jgi:ATP-dependent exoDNAse (exonuclease V) beta subunit
LRAILLLATPTSTHASTPVHASDAISTRFAAFTRIALKLNRKTRKASQPMSKPAIKAAPPDQAQREQALNAARSILVQAPAGSGKTDLLTRRFLRLLGEVDDPSQIVAITFTKASAAEMRHRILSELERASAVPPRDSSEEFSMETLAHRALHRSQALGWQLPDLAANLRISTIDSFCRELAIQQPLLSGFGADLRIDEKPAELYRRAARNTLKQIGRDNSELSAAIEDLLLWRDNNWSELENLIAEMLAKRDRWMHDFVLQREPDWNALRERLEQPFANAVRQAIIEINGLLDLAPGARDEATALTRFACGQRGGTLHQDLAELAEFPCGPYDSTASLEESRCALLCLAELVLTKDGAFRIQINKNNGFPSDRKTEKARLTQLIADLKKIAGLEPALCRICSLPPPRYTEEDWHVVRACFTLLRQGAAELQVVFAEAGAMDFVEVAQIAQRVLEGDDGLPSDSAIAVADGIHHLLVDEFQDTSRRQHRLLASLAAAWPDQDGRTIFVVGDPVQSIYFFRDADAELFPRVRQFGLEIPGGAPLFFDFVPLSANFRTQPALVQDLNEAFDRIFAEDDGSGVTFSPAEPARDRRADSNPRLSLHFGFIPQFASKDLSGVEAQLRKEEIQKVREEARENQTAEIVALIRSHLGRVEQARTAGAKYRIAVLGRTRSALEPIAIALRKAEIPFRSVDLERLCDRPEVLDALALGRALFNSFDRVAWLGVLRAPWCGLALNELYALTGGDQPDLFEKPVPQVIAECIHLLGAESQHTVERVLNTIRSEPGLASSLPTATLGTWLEQIWLSLGGASCVDQTAHENLKLLWRCLDNLPNGAQDFLGSALGSALESLTALPGPAASTECGVQLMTIHKSKGLEFEVVIVPELQARGANTRGKLLSWLERGLAEPDSSGQITEFLVAPIQTRGADRGGAKQWVDRMYRERESQEMRRILYVAATRAREELHFFARPEFKDAAGIPALIEPSNCLLATAWPAIEGQVRVRFEEWAAKEESHDESVIESLAASTVSNLEVMPRPAKPTILRRLLTEFNSPDSAGFSGTPRDHDPVRVADPERYTRHEGGIDSRALGNAVHRLLEESAELRASNDWTSTRDILSQTLPRVKAQIRAIGVTQAEASSIAARALDIAQKSIGDPLGQWILSPHEEAASEAAWTGVVADALRSVRVDRVFRAGLTPLSEGQDAWWIVDYKTAHEDNLPPLIVLSNFRSLFAPQLEAYAEILRRLHSKEIRIRAGLYYPRMSMFDWWAIDC